MGKQFLLLIRHPPLLLIQSSLVKVLSVIEERTIYVKEKDSYPFEILIFRRGHPVLNGDNRMIFPILIKNWSSCLINILNIKRLFRIDILALIFHQY
jgi:hypothetical protein